MSYVGPATVDSIGQGRVAVRELNPALRGGGAGGSNAFARTRATGMASFAQTAMGVAA
jgi:hypothetical protein